MLCEQVILHEQQIECSKITFELDVKFTTHTANTEIDYKKDLLKSGCIVLTCLTKNKVKVFNKDKQQLKLN